MKKFKHLIKRKNFRKNILVFFGVLFLFITIPFTVYLSLRSEEVNTNTKILAVGRDPYKWPFDKYSPWNMPLGSKANYKLAPITPFGYTTEWEIITVDPNAPVRAGKNRSSGLAECGGGTTLKNFHVPNNFTTPIANPNPGAGFFLPNNSGAILVADSAKETIQEGNYIARCAGDSTIYFGRVGGAISIKGSGIEIPFGGGHGGSAMSGFGGSLRKWEIDSPGTPIRHALKITVNGKWLSTTTDGRRWPATNSDGGFDAGCNPPTATSYCGTNTDVKMGSLMVLHRDLDINSLELQTELGTRVAQAIQDFGAYIVDQAYGVSNEFTDRAILNVENGSTIPSGFGNDIMKIFPKFYVITNNTETTPGGCAISDTTCTRVQAYAPDFGSTADTQNPTASLTAPANGATVSGPSVTISADATDNIGVTQVQFFVDNQSVGTDTSSPYSVTWNSTTKANGTYQIFARAFDAAGNQGNSTTRSITVNNVVTPSTSIWCEAESATTISPMIKGSGDTSASTGGYIYTTAPSDTTNVPPVGTGSASLTFNVPNSGTYTLWTRVRYVDGEQNSHFVRFNNSTSYIVVGNDDVFGSYRWVNYRDANTSSLITVSLTAGNNTIHFYGREPNTRIDKILLTSDASFVPTGTGSSANCGVTTSQPADVNNDTKVNVLDLIFVTQRWNTADPTADVNNDNTVNVLDLVFITSRWAP